MKKGVIFDILNDTRENIILVQLMEMVGNLNHSASINIICIYDSNDEK